MMSFYEKDLLTIPLEFSSVINLDIFCKKNNKTVSETLKGQRYKSLEEKVKNLYPKFLPEKIGNFLCYLKKNDDMFYKEFLNKYGDKTFSIFSLANKKHYALKGVYFFYLKGKLVYIGRCRDSLKKRINSGYGKISLKTASRMVSQQIVK